MEPYLILKLIHITAVILFLGNIYTGLFWMRGAHRTKNIAVIAHTARQLIVSDTYFTIPGVVVITAAGILAAIRGGFPLLGTGWIFWPLVLFSVSGIVFVGWVQPLQRKMSVFTKTINSFENPSDWDRYNKLFTAWELWGLIALVTPILAMVMMVMKWPVTGLAY